MIYKKNKKITEVGRQILDKQKKNKEPEKKEEKKEEKKDLGNKK